MEQNGIPKVLDQEQVVPAVGDGRKGLVKTEDAHLLLPVGAQIQAAIELLRQLGPEADDPPAGVADRPDQPAGKPGVGQEIRGPNLVGREAVAEQAVPDGLGRGEVPQRKLLQLPQVEPPLVQACPSRPPGVVAVLAGRQEGLGMAEIGLPQAIGRVLGMGGQRIHCGGGHEGQLGGAARAGLTTQAGQCRMIVANWPGMSNVRRSKGS